MPALNRWKDLILPLAVVASVLVLMVPLPTVLMDLLLIANMALAVIVLLQAIYVRTPLEFSIFPSLLLVTTTSRLVLNVATTRLILKQAPEDQLLAAGQVIFAFGEFVAGGDVIVGLIVFLIIAVIQFVVITKGATRISEVAARFALDGLPGRQMAIDADLQAGAIDDREAIRQRDLTTRQADFYGAMDGASKFVRGDAIAGMVIIAVNILGGLTLGIFGAGMAPADAVGLFVRLAIGDGLVSQVPAFLISLAAALIVTRSTRASNLPIQLLQQLFSRPRTLVVAACFLGILLFTQLPTVPLLLMGSGCVGLAWALIRQPPPASSATEKPAPQSRGIGSRRIEDHLAVDPMELELGLGLVALARADQPDGLLKRISVIRQQVAGEMGVVLPGVRIRDNLGLAPHAYRLKIAGSEVARGRVYPDKLLAVCRQANVELLAGELAEDPQSGHTAVWIDHHLRSQAATLGYRLLEPVGVLTAHLKTIALQYADELLTRDAVSHLVDELRKISPVVVDELIPEIMTLSAVQHVLQMLLREGITIRPLATVLETLADHAPESSDPVRLVEQVRQRLARTICDRYRDEQQRMSVVTLDPGLEDRVARDPAQDGKAHDLQLPPEFIEQLCQQLTSSVDPLVAVGKPPVLLVRAEVRPRVRGLVAARIPGLVVLSYDEITPDTWVESIGSVSMEAVVAA
ncbi:MAG: EscV/YscV/HrcV family type III secretion system export apparatus protein [Planctomycetaceae bacterium]|nr:EscV/YscV/HrcV family type III secretion system export apparatus protein [Planctomycetaceae bacterium]